MANSPFVVKSVDTSGCSLDETASALQHALDEMHAETLSKSIQVFPCRVSYSTPDPDSFHRDFHYTDVGFVLVGTKVNKKASPSRKVNQPWWVHESQTMSKSFFTRTNDAKSYFPILVLYHDENSPTKVLSSDKLRAGVSFNVLETNTQK